MYILSVLQIVKYDYFFNFVEDAPGEKVVNKSLHHKNIQQI